jgi:hypothetical protein
MLEKKLHEELMRYKAINNYAKKMIVEQEVPPPADLGAAPADPSALPTDPAAPAPDAGLPPAPTDAAPTPDTTEEIDITDLVNMTKNIKKEMDDNKSDQGEVLQQMDAVFTKLDDLEQKLTNMDQIISKIDQLSSTVQQMKEPTPVEKLEMRSLDSFPFNQNPQQFFSQKQGEMKQSGKNEYVLTKDEVENYSNDLIKQTFNPETEEDEFKF